MREVSFTWGGNDRAFKPDMAMLARMASDIGRMSEGAENTLSLASKMNAGGADPVFAATALWHMLRSAGVNVTRESAYEQLMGDDASMEDKVSFRVAYMQSVLPAVNMGKKPEAPAAAQAGLSARKKK